MSITDIAAGTSKTFDIPVSVKLEDGTQFAGLFVLRYPSTKDRIHIGLEAAKIRQGNAPEQIDSMTNLYITAFAHLLIVGERFPEECKTNKERIEYISNLDPAVVSAVYTQYLDKRGFFRSGDGSGDTKNVGKRRRAASRKSRS